MQAVESYRENPFLFWNVHPMRPLDGAGTTPDATSQQQGTVRYIPENSPQTVPVTGDAAEALQCFANTCTPGGTLSVTGGQEQYKPDGSLYHSQNSTHYDNLAVDLSGWRNPGLNNQNVNTCALACGFTHGQWESNHWHLQIGPGNGSNPLPMPVPRQ